MSCDLDSIFADLCLSSIDDTAWGLCFEILLVLYCFLALGIVCDEFLVKSLEVLCLRWEVREDIAGASFMAFGSAAPEIIVNAVTTLKGGAGDSQATSLGVGAIIGSGMIAFLVIPGVCGVAAGQELQLKRRPLLRDVTAYSVGLLQLCLYFSDGVIDWHESCLLFGSYLIYILVLWIAPSVRSCYRVRVLGETIVRKRSFVLQAEEGVATQATSIQPRPLDESLLPLQVQLFGEELNAELPPNTLLGDVDRAHLQAQDQAQAQAQEHYPAEALGGCSAFLELISAPAVFVFGWTCPDCERGGPREWVYPVTFLVSFIWVSVFSFVISSAVERWADMSGLNGGFFGLVVIALGAEVPDTIQSLTVARRGYGSMAVSNSTGSQIVNIMIGLGLPWFLSNLGGQPVSIASHSSLEVAALFQVVAIVLNVGSLLGVAVVLGQDKAVLGYRKGVFLLSCYGVLLISYFVVSFIDAQ